MHGILIVGADVLMVTNDADDADIRHVRISIIRSIRINL